MNDHRDEAWEDLSAEEADRIAESLRRGLVFQCCFCAVGLPDSASLMLVNFDHRVGTDVEADDDEEEEDEDDSGFLQQWWCHPGCLKRALHPKALTGPITELE